MDVMWCELCWACPVMLRKRQWRSLFPWNRSWNHCGMGEASCQHCVPHHRSDQGQIRRRNSLCIELTWLSDASEAMFKVCVSSHQLLQDLKASIIGNYSFEWCTGYPNTNSLEASVLINPFVLWPQQKLMVFLFNFSYLFAPSEQSQRSFLLTRSSSTERCIETTACCLRIEKIDGLQCIGFRSKGSCLNAGRLVESIWRTDRHHIGAES